MSVAVDHVGIPAADPWASARFLSEILAEGEITPEGPSGEMASLKVGDSALTYFGLPAHEPHHVAFRVTELVLAGAIGRLRQRGMPFGNDPEDPANGRTDDPLGGTARIYFHDANGHLFELLVPAGHLPQMSITQPGPGQTRLAASPGDAGRAVAAPAGQTHQDCPRPWLPSSSRSLPRKRPPPDRLTRHKNSKSAHLGSCAVHQRLDARTVVLRALTCGTRRYLPLSVRPYPLGAVRLGIGRVLPGWPAWA
jgi:catechol 2,3-dioxygenase-like lactoylglutathione lyase family enzyme